MKSVQVVPKPTLPQTIKLFDELRGSGCIFSAQFIKKDGTIRVINCRTKVKKYLKGGQLKFRAIDKGLITVFDLKKKEYRMLNLNTLIWVKFGGVIYNFGKLPKFSARHQILKRKKEYPASER